MSDILSLPPQKWKQYIPRCIYTLLPHYEMLA